ncbi:TlpA family protein disulfide reductase [Lysobacter pythonis]|uniref:TlpA family protein disulfide reductase n=1 Tax=Solilutibacter pythonis TaxID=2483112 RepID=A0A3M2HKD1_9GAMM|nr:TlpA disulfide reductase family protein [Lysobacter pythonis]RMH89478.1 TlpA family protein disulfide reductase [Lysobacter pythonis]
MNRTHSFLLPLAAAAALLLAACRPEAGTPASGGGAGSPPASSPAAAPRPAKVGDPVALSLPTLDGKTFDIDAHRGQWVLVNYWATWCGPCLEEMPELSALDAMREHIQVIGLAYEDIDADELRGFMRKHPVAYPVALVDPIAQPSAFEAPRGLPVSHLVDPAGKLAQSFLGPVTARRIEEAIASHGGPAVGG